MAILIHQCGGRVPQLVRGIFVGIQTGAQDNKDDRLYRSTAGAAGAQARASTLGSLRANKSW